MSTLTTPHVDVHRGGDRRKTRAAWLDSKHSFSFGDHYDPENTHHGLLLVNNDNIVMPGRGFENHPHRDMEILTWVLSGCLVHRDSLGATSVIGPGLAQRISAGTGILHSETNDSWRLPPEQGGTPEHAEPVHFVQMWVAPDEPGLNPDYQQVALAEELARGGLITVAAGLPRYRHSAAIAVNSSHSALHVARMSAGESAALTLPEAPYLHLYVARGEVDMEGVGVLYQGDAVRLTRSGGQRVTADTPAEVLVWEMHARLNYQMRTRSAGSR